MNYKQFVYLIANFYICEGYKILAIFPIPVYSHYITSSILLKELTKKGHELTVINPFPEKTPIKNYKDISVEFLAEKLNEYKKQLFGLELNFKGQIQLLADVGYMMTEEVLKCKDVQNIMKSGEKFDLVIASQSCNDGLLALAHFFDAPVVLLSTMPLFSWTNFFLGVPINSAFSPNMLTDFTSKMDFWQRMLNTYYNVYSIIYHQYIVLPKHRKLVKKYVPGEVELYNFLNKASLILVNSHVSTNDAVLQVPNIVEIGGYHIKEPQDLPHDLNKFLNESNNGVVLFSLGSNLKSSNLPISKRDALLKAFSKLNQNVLWKWESDDMPGKPINVKLMKWLPQSDVLAHPNVKAFITPGGLLSTMESVYHGVPVIGIPIFADQKRNMALAVSQGYAVVVPLHDLTEELLTEALDQILNNFKFSDNVQRQSKVMKDRPIKPMDEALYWIEYVIRHDGAPHLRYAAMDLYWFQKNLLDVFAFYFLIGIIYCFTVVYFFKLVGKLLAKFSKIKSE